MALNTFRCNRLTPLHFKGLNLTDVAYNLLHCPNKAYHLIEDHFVVVEWTKIADCICVYVHSVFIQLKEAEARNIPTRVS